MVVEFAEYVHKINRRKMEKSKTREFEKTKDKEEEVSLPFHCETCGLSEVCHYFGKSPNFVKNAVIFFEDTFVMRDPFTPRLQGKANFLMIGGICRSCSNQVCVACSIYYENRFCKECAKCNQAGFPAEIRAKIAKL